MRAAAASWLPNLVVDDANQPPAETWALVSAFRRPRPIGASVARIGVADTNPALPGPTATRATPSRARPRQDARFDQALGECGEVRLVIALGGNTPHRPLSVS